MILPEIGGRIHVAQDKTNGYDFIYRQNVIKPALVGLAGPWISSSVEFNWPQHHRPATFLPADVEIEEHDDGAKTVWLGDHDPMRRMKGMHGICLHPDKAYVEIKVRAYNRTEFSQPFLWWANIGVEVDETYQSFFPPDARHVADHAKRATSEYPLCRGRYYGIDYGRRAHSGVAESRNAETFCAAPLQRQSARRLFAERSYMVCEHPHALFLHVPRHEGGFFWRLRSREKSRYPARRGPSHRTGQKTMDVGQSRIRLRVESESCRRRAPLHRIDGGCLHR